MIRIARTDDVARIREIARAAYARYVPRIGREPAPMVANYDADVRAGRIVVLEVEHNVIGYLVAWSEYDAYFIENIGIEPQLQGKGWGRRLVDHAATEAAHLGLPALRLYTNAAMTENLSMYAHLGFVETHRVTEDGFNRVYMRLNLAVRET
jgi:ribosomal protein S18 acetylase RimI-like enzyme